LANSGQGLRSRVLWFIAGAIANYLLISTPFRWLAANTVLPVWAISACSVGIAAVFFFLWNFYVNFRTEARTETVVRRYLLAVIVMWLLSSGVLTMLKQVDVNLAVSIAGHALDFDVIGTQFIFGGLKFFLYHTWVFPAGRS
jgi:hypothetical protein